MKWLLSWGSVPGQTECHFPSRDPQFSASVQRFCLRSICWSSPEELLPPGEDRPWRDSGSLPMVDHYQYRISYDKISENQLPRPTVSTFEFIETTTSDFVILTEPDSKHNIVAFHFLTPLPPYLPEPWHFSPSSLNLAHNEPQWTSTRCVHKWKGQIFIDVIALSLI